MNKADLDYIRGQLNKIYGYKEFRPGQEDIIQTILEKAKIVLQTFFDNCHRFFSKRLNICMQKMRETNSRFLDSVR